jgi:hypothetical protein
MKAKRHRSDPSAFVFAVALALLVLVVIWPDASEDQTFVHAPTEYQSNVLYYAYYQPGSGWIFITERRK